MEREQGPVEHEQELRELFATIDADHNGVLTRAEVAQFAAQLDAPLSEHELDAAMAEMDADGSGDVDIEELLKWCGARKTVSPLKELLQKQLPPATNETGRERELLRLMKTARDSALAVASFVPLDDVALAIPHRRRRAIIPTVSTGHARALQPEAYAFRSQAQIGKSWSNTIDEEVKARALEILAPFCRKEPTGCCCAVYDRVISRRYKPEPGLPGLALQFCLCKERTDQAQREKGGGGTSNELIEKLFNEIDADQSGTLEREEIKLLALRLGKPMTERQLDEAMAVMDANGGGDVDMQEFAVWFRSAAAASASWASSLLQCVHCAEYGLGFSCGGWTERGYTAWEQPGEHDQPQQNEQSCSSQSLRGYTREGGSRTGQEQPKQRAKADKGQKKVVGSRYRSPNLRELRNSSPSRYLTETGSWERQRFVVPTSHDRLEEYALAAEHRRSTSLALLQEYTRRSSSLSPEQPRRGKRGSGSPSVSRSPGSRHESPAAAAAYAGAEPRSGESLPPIVSPSRREHGRQMGGEGPPTAAGTNHGGNDRRHRSVTPSLGQEPTVRGPVRGWASLSPDTSSAQHGCYGSGSSSTWYQRTRPNWYGLDGRTQHAV